MKTTAPLLALVLAPACHIELDGSSFTVDGVRLEEHHEEHLEIIQWDERGLELEVAMGDVKVRRATDGRTLVVATVHERFSNDARLEYREGRLLVETESGEPAAIGDVTVWCAAALPALSVKADYGDVRVERVEVRGELAISSGKGDIRVEHGGSPARGTFATGAGDIRIASLQCDEVEASTGLGDLSLSEVTGRTVALSTGLGDVSLHRSRFEHVEASTGLGDIDTFGSEYVSADLESGLGSVRSGSVTHAVE